MSYFLKLVGLTDDPLPPMWWEERPEIVDGIWFSKPPQAIHSGDVLIYYAVGSGRLCGVAEVLQAPATNAHPHPANWPARRREKLQWWMPVRMRCKIAADEMAPHWREFSDRRATQGSWQRLDDGVAQRMIAEIRRRPQF